MTNCWRANGACGGCGDLERLHAKLDGRRGPTFRAVGPSERPPKLRRRIAAIVARAKAQIRRPDTSQ
jgi:hypothetical protein